MCSTMSYETCMEYDVTCRVDDVNNKMTVNWDGFIVGYRSSTKHSIMNWLSKSEKKFRKEIPAEKNKPRGRESGEIRAEG